MNRVIFRIGHVMAMKGHYEEAGEIREIARDWYTDKICGKAAMAGLLDRMLDDGMLSYAEHNILMEAVMSQRDNFDDKWQRLFGEVEAPIGEVVRECRELIDREGTPLVDAVCRECGIPIRIPVEVVEAAPYAVLCRRHLIAQLDLAIVDIVARVNERAQERRWEVEAEQYEAEQAEMFGRLFRERPGAFYDENSLN